MDAVISYPENAAEIIIAVVFINNDVLIHVSGGDVDTK